MMHCVVRLIPMDSTDKLHGPFRVKKCQMTDWDFTAILEDNSVIWITFGSARYILDCVLLPE